MDMSRCGPGLLNHFQHQVMDQSNFPLPCLPPLEAIQKIDRSYTEEKTPAATDLGKYYAPSPVYLESNLNYFHLKEQPQSLNRCNPQIHGQFFRHHNEITPFSTYSSTVQRMSEPNAEGVVRVPPADDVNIGCLPVTIPNLTPPFQYSVLCQNELFGIQKSNLSDKPNVQCNTCGISPLGKQQHSELNPTENNRIGLNLPPPPATTPPPEKNYLQLPSEPQIVVEKIDSKAADINPEIESNIKSTDVDSPKEPPTLKNSGENKIENNANSDTESNSNQNFVLKTNRVVFCTVCRKGYGSAESLSNHMLTHGPHKCQACGKKFSRQCNLKIHMAVHADRNFLCQECGKAFKSANSLQTHKNTVHESAENGNVVCDTCGIVLKNRKSLVQHEQMHTLGKRFACDLCDERFHRKEALNRHVVRIHVEEKFFTCQVCNIHFNTNEGLQDHLWVHESERPHQCKCCKRRFPQRSGLDRHLKTHLDHRQFTCGVCGLSFTRAYRLKTHMQRHSATTNSHDQK